MISAVNSENSSNALILLLLVSAFEDSFCGLNLSDGFSLNGTHPSWALSSDSLVIFALTNDGG